jgi:2,4-dienoyl-CoA reductase-like NADH-dependent reductase (Old Yellow Enzyme family)/thioredoxin reductase
MAANVETAAQFKHLFTPLRIGSFTVPNRIVSTAHGTSMAENGLPSQRMQDYWVSKAKGGIGLIITEADNVHPSAGMGPWSIHLWRDEIIEPFRRIADAVHEHGTRIVAQLNHSGRHTYGQSPFSPIWSASGVVNQFARHLWTPHEMTVEEIKEVVASFGSAARRIRDAGLDGVEIHASHGYLIPQFMSPLSNIREDEYGGSEENRLRFPREVIDAIRGEVGADFTVGIRVDSDEFEEGGLGQEDVQRIVGKLTSSNQLDYVSATLHFASNRTFGQLGVSIPPMYVEPGQFVYLAAGIKQVTDLPVICIGRINNPVMAEAILERNEADLVGMTRANICDPELPNKAREGRLDEIRYCIACNEGCLNSGIGTTCALNPSVGMEAYTQITPVETKKRVMVVGGGIAGMEAARVAAARGHQVTLYEKQGQLGGQLQIAAKAPGRADMVEPVRYYERQFELLEVPVHLSTAVDEEIVRKESPDAVIVATGGQPASPPPIEGIGEDGTAAGVKVVSAWDVLAGNTEVEGDRVAVLAIDQDMESLTTADFLADRGKQVEMLIPFPDIAVKVEALITKPLIINRLLKKKVKMSIMTAVKAVRDGVVIAHNPPDGPEWPLEGVRTLVIAAGSRADDALWKAVRGQVSEVYQIGECHSPRRLHRSTLDGLQTGLRV